MSLDIYLVQSIPTNVYESNCTHNLVKMAQAVGLYDCLWRPEENGYKTARNLIKPLTKGLKLLMKKPTEFKKLNPENGWGDYEYFGKFVTNLLLNCHKYPKARIQVSV